MTDIHLVKQLEERDAEIERLRAENIKLRDQLHKAYAQLYPDSHTGRILAKSVPGDQTS